MATPNTAIALDNVMFVKKETTFNTLVYPVSADAVLINDNATFEQERIFLTDKQRRRTLSRMDRVAGPYKVGEWQATTYIKPSGALGTEPVPKLLLEALFGIETVTGSTSVVYTLGGIDLEIISLSIVYKQGHVVYWNSGCVVDQGIFPIEAGESDEAIGQATFSGYFAKQVRAGVSAINNVAGYIATSTEIIVDDSTCYDVGAKIEIALAAGGWTDNTGAGYLISAINYTTHTLTIEALADAVADNAEVRGFVPSVTEAGYLVHGQYGAAQEKVGAGSYTDIDISKSEVLIKNNFQIIDDVKVDDSYPAQVVKAGEREVGFKISEVLIKGYAKHFYHSKESTVMGWKIPIGDTVAYRYRFEAAYVEFALPKISGDAELRGEREGMCFGSSGDDEISLTFD